MVDRPRVQRHLGAPGQDRGHRHLEFLAGAGVRDTRCGDHLVGHVPRRQHGADAGADGGDQILVEGVPRRERDEQRHPVGPVGAVDPDHERLGDRVDGFDRFIDVGRAHPDPVPVQRRVAAAMDHQRAAVGDSHPVAVAPYPRRRTVIPLVVEIRCAVTGSVRVIPEPDGHGRHRRGDHHLAHLADQRPPLWRPRLQSHPEIAGGQFPGQCGHPCRAAGESGDDIGAAAHRGHLDVLSYFGFRPLEQVGRQRRSGASQGAQPAQVMLGTGMAAGFAGRQQVARAGTEVADLLGLQQAPQPIGVGVHRVAAVGDHRRAAEQPGGAEIPHHPAQRRLPEEHVGRSQICVQSGGLEVFEQHPAVAVHDALGPAGGAGGEEHPQRMVERHRGHFRLDRVIHEIAILLPVEIDHRRVPG